MKTKIYQGLLSHIQDDIGGSALGLSSLGEPLAEALKWLCGKQVALRYWICDKQCTKEKASEDAMQQAMGLAKTDLDTYYSEVTGHMWVDEKLMVGGHDLLRELYSGAGKWLILEIDVH